MVSVPSYLPSVNYRLPQMCGRQSWINLTTHERSDKLTFARIYSISTFAPEAPSSDGVSRLIPKGLPTPGLRHC